MPISTLFDQNLFLHILLESRLLATSQTPNALAKIVAVAIIIKLNSYSAYFEPNYTTGQKLNDQNIHIDFPVEL